MAEEKYCKFCGKKIPKDSIVCPKCGRQLELVNNAPKQETPKAEKPKKNSNAVKIIRYVVGGLLILACLGSPNFFSGLLIYSA